MGRRLRQILMVGILFVMPMWCQAYVISPELKQELTAYQVQFEQTPSSNRVRFDLAMAYAYTGQIMKGFETLKPIPLEYSHDVIREYSQKMADNPSEWRYPFKLAFGYYVNKQPEKAVECFDIVLSIDPKHIWAMGFKGLIFAKDLNRLDDAISLCQRALEIDPDATYIHLELAEGYRRQGRYLKAFSHMLKFGRLQAEEARHD